MIRRASQVIDKQRVAVIGLLWIGVTVLISYQPSIRVGFLGDDWWFLGKAASLNLFDYLAFYFDPRTQIFWYRPLYGILLFVEYLFFRADPDGYHWGQITLHAINCLLLAGVIWQFTYRRRLALLTALLYAALPINSLAIFWIAVQDPLSMTFYLVAIWMWIIYLQRASRLHYTLAFIAFTLSLLGKESSVFLPITLFLIDRLLVPVSFSWRDLVKRYALFGVTFAAYLALEYRVQSMAYFPNRWGYSFGPHVFENLAHYLALLFFPWGQDEPIIYVALGLGLIVVGIIGFAKRGRLMVFLGLQALLAIAPAVAFPVIFFQARYLYFAAPLTAILFALVTEWLGRNISSRRWALAVPVLFAVGIVFANSTGTALAAVERVEEGRRMRVPLRDIYRDHPSFPPDTYLYFVEPPYPMIMRNLTGMFILPYGSNVSVWSNDAEWGGVDEDRFANLRAHKNSFVYYFDEDKQRTEVPVASIDFSSASPALPVRFQSAIRLEGYELSASQIKRGSALVILLYWRGIEPIDRDYTVFVHLVDENGKIVLGQDSPPRGGRAPTSEWKPGKLVVDAHLLHIDAGVPLGKYRMALGLYYLPTQEQLGMIDANGTPIAHQIVLSPLEVVE